MMRLLVAALLLGAAVSGAEDLRALRADLTAAEVAVSALEAASAAQAAEVQSLAAEAERLRVETDDTVAAMAADARRSREEVP